MQFTSEITVNEIQHMGSDAMVVAAAKVSTTGDEAQQFAKVEATQGNFGLINYLMKHRHGTPFEHGAITVFVKAPTFVWWEWVRHRIGFSYNLESSRYKKLDPLFWIPSPTRAMIPSKEHKPSRPRFDPTPHEHWEREVTRTKEASALAYKHYLESIEDGICTEVARDKLPFNIYFSGWVTCNPRSIMSFLSLRTHEEKYDPNTKTGAIYVSFPQAEIEEAGRKLEAIFSKHWPLTYRSFVENGRVGP